jgi:molybdenum cofactor biosynthesis enzyme MoaA
MFKCGYLSGSLWVGNDERHVYPCCFTNNKETRYQPPENPTYEYLNNEIILNMRRAALRGDTPSLCEGCGYERRKSLNEFKNKGEVKEYISYEDIERLHVSLGNVCNFKCVICSGHQSHLIAREIAPQLNSYLKNESYFDFLIDNLPKMKNLNDIQFTGGEPFYNKKNLLNILNKLPDHVNIHPLRTNGSIFDLEILEALKRFPRAVISFSYDSYSKTLEYQRPNSNWSDMEKVLDKFLDFKDKNPNIEIGNDFTVTWINVDSMLDFHLKFKKKFNEIRYHPIEYPNYWQIKMLKPEYQQTILKDIFYVDRNVHEHMVSRLNSDVTDREINIMWHHIGYMKKHRNVSLEEKIPHIIPFLRKTSLQLS